MVIVVMGCGKNMNKFYRKPKPETMKKNRETYAELYDEEMKWLKNNLQGLTDTKNKFILICIPS